MAIIKFLSLFLILIFPLGELSRFEFKNGINFTLNDITVVILFIVWFISNLKKKKKTIKCLLLKPITLFITIALISLIVNMKSLNQFELTVSFFYLLRWILYSSIYFVISGFDFYFKQKIIHLMVFVGVIFVIGGYIQYFFYSNLGNLYYSGWDNHMHRIFSSFFDPNFAGAFFVLYLILISSIFIEKLKTKNQKTKLLFFLLMILTLIAILLTYSRSALLMFLTSSIVFLILIKKKKLIFLIIGILLLAFLAFSKNFYIENVNLLRTASSEARIDSLSNVTKIIRDHPILGVGFNTYKYAQIKYGFREENNAKTSHADAGTDNSFLFILATTGVIGFTSYIYLWFIILKSNIKDYKNKKQYFLSIIIISSCLGLFVNALFINSLFFPFIMQWMWILVGLRENN